MEDTFELLQLQLCHLSNQAGALSLIGKPGLPGQAKWKRQLPLGTIAAGQKEEEGADDHRS